MLIWCFRRDINYHKTCFQNLDEHSFSTGDWTRWCGRSSFFIPSLGSRQLFCMLSIILSQFQQCKQVCDNVDLKIILEEYSSYHQVKYGKRPDICRRAEKEAGSEGYSLQGNPARRKKAQRALNKMKRWLVTSNQYCSFRFPMFNWNKDIWDLCVVVDLMGKIPNKYISWILIRSPKTRS